jgi:hypothetical protein
MVRRRRLSRKDLLNRKEVLAMPEWITQLAGWLPGLIFPIAAFLQLEKLRRKGSAEGVSIAAWLLYGVGNLGWYVFTEKYWAIQALVGVLGTAILDFAIVAVVISLNRRRAVL